MKRNWLAPLLTAGLLLAPMATIAQNADVMIMTEPEGYDVQTPAEIEAARANIERDFGNATPLEAMTEEDKAPILAKYAYLDPQHEVPTSLLEDAVLYFDKNKDKFPNQLYITIVDFSARSDKARLFLIDMTTGVVEKYHTTHGLHSDEDRDGLAERFGNVVNSGRSSLGFVRTAELYNGKFGRSVRLDGLSATNSNIRQRAVVLHGWDQTFEKDVIQGWSWGCITLDYAIRDNVIDKVAAGSLMYVGLSVPLKKAPPKKAPPKKSPPKKSPPKKKAPPKKKGKKHKKH